MNEYIPKGMVQKQYQWEHVNYYLYQHLLQQNPFSKLQDVMDNLLKLQEKQLLSLQKLADFERISIPSTSVKIEFKPILECVGELHDREYQLLQEYLSYSEYFIPSSAHQLDIKDMVDNKILQVNTLIGLKQTLSHLVKKDQNKKADYILEKGYRLERIITGLNFPTVMTFDSDGTIYIAEAGFVYGLKPGKGRILRLESNRTLTEISNDFDGPVTGLHWHQGYFYIAEGSIAKKHGSGCGQISRITLGGKKETIVTGLKTCGDHYTGDVLFGPDGKLYFSVGTATNSVVVGLDNRLILKSDDPKFHDTPARNSILAGVNFITHDPLSTQPDVAVTGAYKPFGTASYDGEIIPGQLMATGVIYRCNPDGSDLQIVADGFRNTFGLRFSPFNGKLIVTDHGADPRGSRSIRLDWDKVWEVTPQGWYGFPDFFSGLPVTLSHFHVTEQAKSTFVLKEHPPLAHQPLIRFQSHSASMKFDFCTNANFGHLGEIFVAQYGETGYEYQKELPGFKVARANLETGQITDFLVNPKGDAATNGPIRPIDAKFSPDGNALYILDLGHMNRPQPNTGSLWKIVKI